MVKFHRSTVPLDQLLGYAKPTERVEDQVTNLYTIVMPFKMLLYTMYIAQVVIVHASM